MAWAKESAKHWNIYLPEIYYSLIINPSRFFFHFFFLLPLCYFWWSAWHELYFCMFVYLPILCLCLVYYIVISCIDIRSFASFFFFSLSLLWLWIRATAMGSKSKKERMGKKRRESFSRYPPVNDVVAIAPFFSNKYYLLAWSDLNHDNPLSSINSIQANKRTDEIAE